jgi:hypothetical protein
MSTRQLVLLSVATLLILVWVTIVVTWADAPARIAPPKDHPLFRLDHHGQPGAIGDHDDEMDCPGDESDDDDDAITPVVMFARLVRGDQW